MENGLAGGGAALFSNAGQLLPAPHSPSAGVSLMYELEQR